MKQSGFWGNVFPIERIRHTIRRFPLPVVCCIIAFVLASYMLLGSGYSNEKIIHRASVVTICSFFALGTLRLFFEERSAEAQKKRIYEVIGSILIVGVFAYVVFASSKPEYRLAFMLPGTLLLLMASPFQGNDSIKDFWFYNYKLWTGAGFALFTSFVFWLGISAGLKSVEILFGLDVDSDVYGVLAAFSAFILAPIYTLSWIPDELSCSDDICKTDGNITFVIEWILAPLVLLYLAILYAYYIKVLAGNIPEGQLAYLTGGFAGVGLITYFAGWPLHTLHAQDGAEEKASHQPLKLVGRILFPALIIPSLFLIYATYVRLIPYGVTEQRYALVLFGIWLATGSAAYTFKKTLSLKYLPMSLGALLLMASFGPWGATSVSSMSQKKIFSELLIQKETANEEELKRMSSIIDYLGKSGKYKALQSFIDLEKFESNYLESYPNSIIQHKLEEVKKECWGKWDYLCAKAYAETLGIKYYDRWSYSRPRNYIWYGVSYRGKPTNIDGYNTFYSAYTFRIGENLSYETDIKGNTDFEFKDGQIIYHSPDPKDDPLIFNLKEQYGQLNTTMKAYSADPQDQIILKSRSGNLYGKIHLLRLNGERKEDGTTHVEFIEFDAFIGNAQ